MGLFGRRTLEEHIAVVSSAIKRRWQYELPRKRCSLQFCWGLYLSEYIRQELIKFAPVSACHFDPIPVQCLSGLVFLSARVRGSLQSRQGL